MLCLTTGMYQMLLSANKAMLLHFILSSGFFYNPVLTKMNDTWSKDK